MKQKLTGILSLTAILTLVLVLVIVKWKEILVGLGAAVMAVVAVVIFGLIVALIGAGIKGDKWD
jgi:hypothetical protein